MGRRKFNLTETNALDYNCNTSCAVASGLYRPRWRRSDSSSARDCRRCARYQPHSRQTALSESVFRPGSISGPCVRARSEDANHDETDFDWISHNRTGRFTAYAAIRLTVRHCVDARSSNESTSSYYTRKPPRATSRRPFVIVSFRTFPMIRALAHQSPPSCRDCGRVDS